MLWEKSAGRCLSSFCDGVGVFPESSREKFLRFWVGGLNVPNFLGGGGSGRVDGEDEKADALELSLSPSSFSSLLGWSLFKNCGGDDRGGGGGFTLSE